MIRILYRRLLFAGFSNEEASNLIANLMGLGKNENGWKTSELIHLLYEEYRTKSTRP